MAKNSMDLLELLRKSGMDGDVDFLREALQVLVEGIMDAEVSAQIGAQHGERNPERVTHRNGYRGRDWDTRVGTMELRIPKVREGSYLPSLLEPRRRSEKALLAVIQQAYVEGVSTRRVDDLIKSLGWDLEKPGVAHLPGLGPGGGDLSGPAPGWRPLSLRLAGRAHLRMTRWPPSCHPVPLTPLAGTLLNRPSRFFGYCHRPHWVRIRRVYLHTSIAGR